VIYAMVLLSIAIILYTFVFVSFTDRRRCTRHRPLNRAPPHRFLWNGRLFAFHCTPLVGHREMRRILGTRMRFINRFTFCSLVRVVYWHFVFQHTGVLTCCVCKSKKPEVWFCISPDCLQAFCYDGGCDQSYLHFKVLEFFKTISLVQESQCTLCNVCYVGE